MEGECRVSIIRNFKIHLLAWADPIAEGCERERLHDVWAADARKCAAELDDLAITPLAKALRHKAVVPVANWA